MPCDSTVRNWVNNLSFEAGILNPVFDFMKDLSSTFSLLEKWVVLKFDEVFISNKIEFDTKREKVLGPHKSCLLVMCCGIAGKWKQSLFYDFDAKMTEDYWQ